MTTPTSIREALAARHLPDALTSIAGDIITNTAQWPARRAEILELLRSHVYGRAPLQRPESLSFRVEYRDEHALDGMATFKQIAIEFAGHGGTGRINLQLFVPNNRSRPAPAFLLVDNRGAHSDPHQPAKSDFWPVELIVARGYAAAAFFNGDIDPDEDDDFRNGVHGVFDAPRQEGEARAGDAWGTIAAWAWGASRALDYLETDVDIDAARVAVVGHSRGGKTALWAGAEDPRFALAISNQSGSTGAALSRGKSGESIERINTSFPHWFAANYRNFNGREDQLPVDQHQLIALMAPRPVYISSATEDAWADPESEFLAGVAASPVYQLFDLPALNGAMTAPDESNHDGLVGHHLRTGKHGMNAHDWTQFMNFADKRMARQPENHAANHA